MFLERRQCVWRELPQPGITPGVLFLLKEPHCLIVILDHIADIFVVKGLAVQSLELFAHSLVFRIESLWHLDPHARRSVSQLLTGSTMVSYHTICVALHLRVR